MGATRYVSLGSCVIGVVLPAVAIWRQQGEYVLWALSIGVGAFIILRHRSNLRRIVRGEESRLFSKDFNLAEAARTAPRKPETKP
jgi:glycerol-3-phosphate acyltransferase PlsY